MLFSGSKAAKYWQLPLDSNPNNILKIRLFIYYCLNLKLTGCVDLETVCYSYLLFWNKRENTRLEGWTLALYADLNNLLFCCQCGRGVLQPRFKSGRGPQDRSLRRQPCVHAALQCEESADIQDSSIIQTQDLFTINRDPPRFQVLARSLRATRPYESLLKIAFFCSCLSDILRFIYSGILSNGSGTAS